MDAQIQRKRCEEFTWSSGFFGTFFDALLGRQRGPLDVVVWIVNFGPGIHFRRHGQFAGCRFDRRMRMDGSSRLLADDFGVFQLLIFGQFHCFGTTSDRVAGYRGTTGSDGRRLSASC